MKKQMNDKLLTVYLEGHIDSSNVYEKEEEIKAAISHYSPEALVLDAEKLDYISSAGLRLVLKLRKMFSELKVTNTSSDVYEIFDMTGFTELVNVEKAYRVFDITGCELIGEGANGCVYRLTRDAIVKVYKDADSLEEIKRERELSRTAFLLGIPTAIPYDVVRVGDTYGSVFELLNAKSFAELMREDEGNLDFVAEESMAIAKLMHSTKAPDNLPVQRDISLQWVETVKDCFTPEQHAKLKKLIEDIPEDGNMLHGDLHIKNIMRQHGETLLIDMDTLSTGHPIYELAFMYNAYKGFGIVDERGVSDFLGIPFDTSCRLFRRSLEVYLGTNDKCRLDEVEQKAELIGLLRIMRRVIRMGNDKTPEGRKLMTACYDRMTETLNKVDTLTF